MRDFMFNCANCLGGIATLVFYFVVLIAVHEKFYPSGRLPTISDSYTRVYTLHESSLGGSVRGL